LLQIICRPARVVIGSHLGPDHTLRNVSQLFGVRAWALQISVATDIAFDLVGWFDEAPTAERSEEPTIAAHLSWLTAAVDAANSVPAINAANTAFCIIQFPQLQLFKVYRG
jgi:hypothetical protein